MMEAQETTEAIFTHNAAEALRGVISRLSPTRCLLVYPAEAGQKLLQTLNAPDICRQAIHLPHPEGENNKTIATVTQIWQRMLTAGADRQSVIINLGGGLTTDLGGFAAACYMRSIRYVNVPTTLLGAVDAACGGKTGVNIDGVKNIAGAFHMPAATIISPQFLATLPSGQILSGWAEMLKHALLTSPEAISRYLATDPLALDGTEWLPLIQESVNFKRSVADADPHEGGLRRILNLGHTAGHALESLCNGHGKPVTHGHAVALGTVTALVLSHLHAGFDSQLLHLFARTIRALYPPVHFTCADYPALLSLMHHDKKNRGSGHINFVLLAAPGAPIESTPLDDETIRTALDITRDLSGI